MARQTRIIYVENDPILRGMIATLLTNDPRVEVLGVFGSSDEVLASESLSEVDVALLDLALGPGSLNGHELAFALRARNPDIGIVIMSQHPAAYFVDALPEDIRFGWSFVEKRADTNMDDLVEVLQLTSRGFSSIDPRVAEQSVNVGPSLLSQLTVRHQQILALAAVGLDANAIAAELNLSSVTVRKDLSKAYEVLVPNPRPGTDLRTTAVLRYLRETRPYSNE
ncbi:MAG: response regulator transcription factor [Actinobacteria bacterium]|nr:response regulator transcription factor [Actinomycetota bacterium]